MALPLELQPSQPIEMSPKEAMHIAHLALNISPTPEAFTALVLTPEIILLELLITREPRPLPPVILTITIAGWGQIRIFDAGLYTSKLVVKLQRLNFS